MNSGDKMGSKKIKIGPYLKVAGKDPKTGAKRYDLSEWAKQNVIQDPSMARILLDAERQADAEGIFLASKLMSKCEETYKFPQKFTFDAVWNLFRMGYIGKYTGEGATLSSFGIIKERLDHERHYLKLLIKHEEDKTKVRI
jgi:hypothetical protein